MVQHSKDLDHSWVVNDTDDSDLSWAGESQPSDSDREFTTTTHKVSPRQRQYRSPRKTTSTTTPVPLEPELVMPSIDTPSSPPRRRVVSQGRSLKSTPIKQERSRTVDARSTPLRTQRSLMQDDQSNRLTDMVVACFDWLAGTIGYSLKYLQKPIGALLALGFLYLVWTIVYDILTNSITSALSPICHIPGAGLLNLPMCRSHRPEYPKLSAGGEVADPEFAALMKVQSQFETIMSDTAASASLPMDLKRSEISIRDLRQLVRYSQLPSRHELENELDGFVETARIVSYDLQRFDSHVGRSVDVVLSTNKWTRRVLDDIDLQQSGQGLLPLFISNTLLAPFRTARFTETRLLDQYVKHSHIVSDEIDKLIEEAQALLSVLQNLEDRLDVMSGIAERDKVNTHASKDEVLREIWSYIGLNNAKLGKYDKQLQLLSTFSGYRRAALNHVTLVLVELQKMSHDLNDLRERVMEPGLARQAGRQVPLSVHIENIQLGVERLEAGRERAKELQQKHTRKVLDRAQGDGELRFIPSN